MACKFVSSISVERRTRQFESLFLEGCMVAQTKQEPAVANSPNSKLGIEVPLALAKHLTSSGSLSGYQTCLEMIKHKVIHKPVTESHCARSLNIIAFKLPLRCPVEVECIAHSAKDWQRCPLPRAFSEHYCKTNACQIPSAMYRVGTEQPQNQLRILNCTSIRIFSSSNQQLWCSVCTVLLNIWSSFIFIFHKVLQVLTSFEDKSENMQNFISSNSSTIL